MFEFLVYVNNAPEPVAGFAYRKHAEEWAEENYPGKYKIRWAAPLAGSLFRVALVVFVVALLLAIYHNY